MNIWTEDKVKKVDKIRERIKSGFYFTRTVTELIAENILKELKWKK